MAADHLNLLFGRILPFSGFYEANRPGLMTQICVSENRSIPPEVYDAPISKRVYKESMSFEKANAIIMESMGSRFDPALEPVCLEARPEPEAYEAYYI